MSRGCLLVAVEGQHVWVRPDRRARDRLGEPQAVQTLHPAQASAEGEVSRDHPGGEDISSKESHQRESAEGISGGNQRRESAKEGAGIVEEERVSQL